MVACHIFLQSFPLIKKKSILSCYHGQNQGVYICVDGCGIFDSHRAMWRQLSHASRNTTAARVRGGGGMKRWGGPEPASVYLVADAEFVKESGGRCAEAASMHEGSQRIPILDNILSCAASQAETLSETRRGQSYGFHLSESSQCVLQTQTCMQKKKDDLYLKRGGGEGSEEYL